MSNWIKPLNLNQLIFALVFTFFATSLHASLEVEKQGNTTANVRIVEVGVLAIRGNLYAQRRWQPTMDWLTSQIPDTKFVLRPFNLNGMALAVKELQVDFILTNPGQAVKLGRQYALAWMATMTSHMKASPIRGIGSALVVRQVSPYFSVEQLNEKSIAAVSENAFGGYLTMHYEVRKQGLNPENFFSNTQFLDFPIDASLYKLRDGNIEAAIVPVCLLENMISEGLLNGDQYRVINNMTPEGFPCQVSTPLYPNWSFAKTERAANKLAKLISSALFSMPGDSEAAKASGATGWTSPISHLSIDKLYQELDIHPLQQSLWKKAFNWIKYNQHWAWAFFIFVVVLNGYHFWLEYKFSRSKKQLEETLHRLKEKSELLEQSQRIAVIGELGSSLAHEINQPLAAIRNYSEGGLLRLAKRRPAEDIVPVFEKIHSQVERADAIIQRLRMIIKKRTMEKRATDIEQLITETIELLEFRLSKQNILCSRSSKGTIVPLTIDAIGFQQVIVNMVNNSVDACISYRSQESNPDRMGKVLLHTEYNDQQLVISIIDNGTGLSTEGSLLTHAFVSTKSDGLGLGLAICRDILEDHHGEFTLESIQPHGCKATIFIPYKNGSQ